METTVKVEQNDGGATAYWRQHAALQAKYRDDVEYVLVAFHKYVDHLQGESDQKKKLQFLVRYVELCSTVLNESAATHAPRGLDELDKVYKYIVKIVNPYMKKLVSKSGKRGAMPRPRVARGPAIESRVYDTNQPREAHQMDTIQSMLRRHQQQMEELFLLHKQQLQAMFRQQQQQQQELKQRLKLECEQIFQQQVVMRSSSDFVRLDSQQSAMPYRSSIDDLMSFDDIQLPDAW